jgi:hypothetical protein
MTQMSDYDVEVTRVLSAPTRSRLSSVRRSESVRPVVWPRGVSRRRRHHRARCTRRRTAAVRHGEQGRSFDANRLRRSFYRSRRERFAYKRWSMGRDSGAVREVGVRASSGVRGRRRQDAACCAGGPAPARHCRYGTPSVGSDGPQVGGAYQLTENTPADSSHPSRRKGTIQTGASRSA